MLEWLKGILGETYTEDIDKTAPRSARDSWQGRSLIPQTPLLDAVYKMAAVTGKLAGTPNLSPMGRKLRLYLV